MQYQIGSKSAYQGHPVTKISEELTSVFGGAQEWRRSVWRFDLPQGAESYGVEEIALEDTALGGPVWLRNDAVRVELTLEAWVAALAAARQGKDEASPAIAARGQILGKAAEILRNRQTDTAPASEPTEQEIEDAAIHLHMVKSYGHEGRALEKLRAGSTNLPHRIKAVPHAFSDTLAETRAATENAAALDGAMRARRAVAPEGWEVW